MYLTPHLPVEVKINKMRRLNTHRLNVRHRSDDNFNSYIPGKVRYEKTVEKDKKIGHAGMRHHIL